ncbi:MAG: glycosyl hydrolase, partial [Sphingobacteriaceae bacterium]
AEQLSPQWWDMLGFAMAEAKRLNLKLGMHFSDGFALGGGPWITPELSMQKVVFSRLDVSGGRSLKLQLPDPEKVKDYYRDIRLIAFPSLTGSKANTQNIKPKITSSTGEDLSFLINPDGKQAFRSSEDATITYQFKEPFTCRSIYVASNGNNYQAQRLLVQVSDDGLNFKDHQQLEAPRHGWQDDRAEHTYSMVPVSAKYFRFLFKKEGSLPGAEDLEYAKWKPSIKLTALELFAEPKLNQFESKNGQVWRISDRTTAQEIEDKLCIDPKQILDLTSQLNAQGELNWQAPAGNWTLLRIGHTSTGYTNATGGAAAGLECDKFNPEAIQLQFNNWYGKALALATQKYPDVLNVFHVDSWECGSQNWSDNFASEFQKRRGYSLLNYLPVMAGFPIESAARSEQVLYDVRTTIADLLNDVFFKTLSDLTKQNGLQFTAESVAPTMVSDGLLHYKNVTIPMGEFWSRSPTHDKPNDMLDAISAAHIYGKNIVQAEAFTTVMMDWSEHPAMLKTLQDRNYALGINKMVYHVYTHNPWTDRKPGMTLDGVGLYFQRDQTWWKPGKAWVDYAARCQELLQMGNPVVDVAVFTGEEVPRRSVLPDRLVNTLPGIFGEERLQAEAKRLANVGQPQRKQPKEVKHSANMADPENWVDPLKGYAYDSFNPDALQHAEVHNGRVRFSPNGAAYKLLVLPIDNPMNPNDIISEASLNKIKQLEAQGITVIKDRPYLKTDFTEFGLSKDLIVSDYYGNQVGGIAWNHRTVNDQHIYFISNQHDYGKILNFSFRLVGKIPELFDPVNNTWTQLKSWQNKGGRLNCTLMVEPAQSFFIVFRKDGINENVKADNWSVFNKQQDISEDWSLKFDTDFGGPAALLHMQKLSSWTASPDSAVKYYSGTVRYTKVFKLKKEALKNTLWLNLGELHDLASVKLNGKEQGVIWTAPHRINISSGIKAGKNKLEIAVSNTWANRLIGDHNLPAEKRITQTTAPYRLEGSPLLPAGLIGPVIIEKEEK